MFVMYVKLTVLLTHMLLLAIIVDSSVSLMGFNIFTVVINW